MGNNLISIIITNYNGLKWLKKCLDSLFSQTYNDFEIILVDNGSTDDSIKFLEENYRDERLKIVRSEKNLGFAGGNNLGFNNSKGEYILLLNNDTWVENDFLKEFMNAFANDKKIGCVQSKILLMDEKDRLDTVGAYWTNSSFLYYFGSYKKDDSDKYNEPMPFFSCKGASMMIKREIVNKIGNLFDEDFWCYYEDTDLCNMIWSMGYDCWYWPDAVCYHANGGTALNFKSDYVQFHNFKNKLLSFLKNYEIKTLTFILPIYLILCIIISFIWLLSGKVSNFLAIYKSFFWNIKNINKTLEKRKIVQSRKIKSDKEIFKIVKQNPRIEYYFYLFTGLEKYKD